MVIPNASAPSPSHHQSYRWYKLLPFPVMGGKNDIVLPTLMGFNQQPWELVMGL